MHVHAYVNFSFYTSFFLFSFFFPSCFQCYYFFSFLSLSCVSERIIGLCSEHVFSWANDNFVLCTTYTCLNAFCFASLFVCLFVCLLVHVFFCLFICFFFFLRPIKFIWFPCIWFRFGVGGLNIYFQWCKHPMYSCARCPHPTDSITPPPQLHAHTYTNTRIHAHTYIYWLYTKPAWLLPLLKHSMGMLVYIYIYIYKSRIDITV